jgi:hypothetical protein
VRVRACARKFAVCVPCVRVPFARHSHWHLTPVVSVVLHHDCRVWHLPVCPDGLGVLLGCGRHASHVCRASWCCARLLMRGCIVCVVCVACLLSAPLTLWRRHLDVQQITGSDGAWSLARLGHALARDVHLRRVVRVRVRVPHGLAWACMGLHGLAWRIVCVRVCVRLRACRWHGTWGVHRWCSRRCAPRPGLLASKTAH